MKLSEELVWRGFFNQTTLSDVSVLDKAPISFYFGADPSADSLTIGNLAAIMMVRHFINRGHKAYMLVGGATGMIGDPDGKKDERQLKTLDEIAHNKTCIVKQYQFILNEQSFTVVDNYDWFKDIKYLDFLYMIGKHVPMGQMLNREFVKNRLGDGGSGISYAEFSYALIQGYDFLYLYREYGVTLQLCGADQWGNSIAGVDLIRRLESVDAHVYSNPLILNRNTGVKFGKSEDGAIWLDAAKTSIYKFYQFWLNLDDAGVIDYIRIYTLLNKDEIDELEKQHQQSPAKRIAQKCLAREVTQLAHGFERTASVEKVTSVLFGESDFSALNNQDFDILAGEIPTVQLGLTIIEALVSSGLVSSNNEARRLIVSGAISINNQKVIDNQVLNQLAIIKKGKNDFILAR
jgi:tyrosyl-tRNA synthetase